jgi:hypothetical protein
VIEVHEREPPAWASERRRVRRVIIFHTECFWIEAVQTIRCLGLRHRLSMKRASSIPRLTLALTDGVTARSEPCSV